MYLKVPLINNTKRTISSYGENDGPKDAGISRVFIVFPFTDRNSLLLDVFSSRSVSVVVVVVA